MVDRGVLNFDIDTEKAVSFFSEAPSTVLLNLSGLASHFLIFINIHLECDSPR